MIIVFSSAFPAFAIEPIEVSRGNIAIDLTRNVEVYPHVGSTFQVSTVPDANGIRRRIEVHANGDDHEGDWAVFSLANISDEQLDRLIVAPHFRLPGSGVFWPDLGSSRIAEITPSEGFALTREKSDDADVFAITLNPGAVITFVAQLNTPELPQLYLWAPDSYKDTENAFTLYHGVVLGIAGLLAVFLSILFVVRGTSVIPATAVLSWAVLLYIGIDFNFINQLMPLSADNLRIWRASAEVAIALSLVVFLVTYLNLARWHSQLGYTAAAWGVVLMALFGIAFLDPSVAAGIARLSFAATVIAGVALIPYLCFRRYDRAILLIPAWALLTAWVFAAWMATTGRIDNDIVQPALDGGLILIVLLLGFTVIQHSLAGGATQPGISSNQERQAMALLGADGMVWDWDVSRDRIVVEPDVSPKLGFAPGTLNSTAHNWLQYLHPGDRDRFRSTLDLFLEWQRGRLKMEFRVRANDGHYHWMLIRARPVLSTDGEVIRCVGTLSDLTDQKVSTQRLLQDAVIDNLTGLPNRTVFLDRLRSLILFSRSSSSLKPTLIVADIDKYNEINETLGFATGDNILIALTRRIQRLLDPQDTLSRISGNRFAIILLSQTTATDVAEFADALVSAIDLPISFENREISLTASIGVASWHDAHETAETFLEDAHLAMHQSKRMGGDSVETYRPSLRMQNGDNNQLANDLARATDRKEMSLFYRPIVRLENVDVVGFNCFLNWTHPQRGKISTDEIFGMITESDRWVDLILYTVKQAVDDLASWQQALPKVHPFVSIELNNAEVLCTNTLIELENIIRQSEVTPRQIVFSIPENIFLEAPEQAKLAVQHLRSIGAGVTLTNFGNGKGSLSLLKNTRFDTAYIDRSFFMQNQETQIDTLKAFTMLASKFGLKVGVSNVTSEVETQALLKAECVFASGPLYGTSITRPSALKLLRENNRTSKE